MKTLTEKDFMQSVIDLAKTCGWLTYHTHDSRRSTAGFPDLVLVKPPRVVFAELKLNTPGSKTTRAQDVWLAAFAGCPGVEAYVWRPHEFTEIANALKPTRGGRT